MSFQPFQSEFADHRVVLIPPDLDDDRRARFVTKIAAAVRQQAELAAKSDGVLRLSGEIQERGDRILIPHEAAAPGDPAAIGSASEPADINTAWWLTWSLVQALKAVAPGTPHGGIQLATLYLDEAGRVKLGDFGIAPAFEAICGIESRRQVHCDGTVRAAEAGRRCSGVWALLHEDDTREHGWITPYSGHELLEGTLRLNPKSDQFAAGTLLFLLVVGTHPYGASLADPTLMLYFHLEPFSVGEERSDWAEVFERRETGLCTSADQPILAWAESIEKLLNSDPGERYANPAEAEAAVGEFVPAAWGEASAAISAGLKLLDAGDADAFLEKTAPWKDSDALPGLWREQLSSWVAMVESRKEEIGAYKRVEQRLAEGQEALNDVEVERAREIAREVLATPQCDDVLRAAAEELIEFCDEQERFIQSGADDLAKAYLESAREYLDRGQLDEARHLLQGVQRDPATPTARASHARQMLAEVELAEQRIEQQRRELSGVREDLQSGRLQAARQRVEALLREEELPELVAADGQALLDEIIQAQARRAALARALDEARAAWERADLKSLEQHLAEVPEDLADPEIGDVRADLGSRCTPLRTALERRAAVEEALADERLAAALANAEQARGAGELPQILRDQLDELIGRCQAGIEERERLRIEQALASFREAEAACAGLRLDECRRRLEDDVLSQEGLPDEVVRKAEELLRTCERIEQAQTLLERVRREFAAEELDGASRLLDGLKREGLPSAVVDEIGRLRVDVTRACEERAKRERRKLEARLDEIEATLQAGRLDEAESSLKEAEASEHLTGEIRGRIAAARSEIERQQPVLEAIGAAEAALSDDSRDSAGALGALARLPAELPEWAGARVESLRRRAAELIEQQRREAVEQATAALNAAQVAFDGGDVATGRGHLDQARSALELDQALAERHERLTSLAAQLEEWLPKVKAAWGLVERGDFAAARREVSNLLREESIPDLCRTRLVELKDRTERDIAARQKAIDGELAALAAELERRGRRARKFPQRVGALKADALRTEGQNAKADGLLATYEGLPEPKASKAPLAIAGCVGLVAVVCAGLYFGGAFGGGDDAGVPNGSGGENVVAPPTEVSPTRPPAEPPVAADEEPPVAADDARDQIVAALTRLRTELAEAAEQAEADGRVHTDWKLLFEPADELPTTLFVIDSSDGARKETVGVAGTAAELERLRLSPDVREALFPAPPPAPPVAERIAAVVERLQAELDSARTEADRPDAPAPRFVVRLDPADSLPATLIAQNEQSGAEVSLGTVEDEGLETLALTDQWREQLYPPPPVPKKPTLAEVAKAYLDELREALPQVAVNEELLPAADGTFEVAGQWNDRDLHPFTALRFEEPETRFTPPVASVAAHFRLQIEALGALEQPLKVAVAVGPPEERAYEATLRLAGRVGEVVVERVDLGARSVRVTTEARLDGDPRSATGFAFGAVYAGEKFAVDDETRAAFRVYLRDLQKHQLQDSLRGIEQELKLPPGVGLSWPGEFAGGPRVALRVEGANDRTFAAMDAVWNPQTLLYEIDARAAAGALRQGVRDAAQEEATRQALAATWSETRAALAPAEEEPGVHYFLGCELLELAVRDHQPDETFAVAVEVTVGPRDGAAEAWIRFPALLTMDDGALSWTAGGSDEAKAAIAGRLRALAGSEEFRARRHQEALAQLAAELGVGLESVRSQVDGDALRAELTAGDGQRRFTWSWDSGALRYANRVESAPPPPAPVSLDERLAQLASQPAAEVGAFGAVLIEVAQAKIERYGTSGYTLAEGFANAGNPAEGLVAVSQSLQALTAPRLTRDPFPVVFVEYFVGASEVYALGWRAVTAEDDAITGVADTKVWQVMSAAKLRGYPTPGAFRQDYSTDAELGERLLGRAFGEALEGSGKAGGGSFGVIVAPDGLLWLTRWEQVRFDPRAVENVDWRGAGDPGSVTALRQLLKPRQLSEHESAWRRAGVWCVPTLVGEWRGPADRIDKFQLGVLVKGKKPGTLRFKRQAGLTFGPVTDPTLTGDFGWMQFARSVRRAEIGYVFWDRRWSGEGWNPTPFNSFSLIQIP